MKLRSVRGKLFLVDGQIDIQTDIKLKTKLRDLSPQANYTDRAAAAGRRS